jgi:hypothetical protein
MTYLKIGNISTVCHPREGGGPLNALRNMDSRRRGNDDRMRTFIHCEGDSVN